jgi:hypothetical protein
MTGVKDAQSDATKFLNPKSFCGKSFKKCAWNVENIFQMGETKFQVIWKFSKKVKKFCSFETKMKFVIRRT